jgi:hypothetical protein
MRGVDGKPDRSVLVGTLFSRAPARPHVAVAFAGLGPAMIEQR